MKVIPAVRTLLERLRLHHTGRRDALALALFGLAIGLCSGVVALAFRGAIELAQFFLVPAEGYAAMGEAMRFGSPIVGAMLTVGVLYFVARGPVPTGVVHVLEELARAQGRLPFKNAAVQFVAAARTRSRCFKRQARAPLRCRLNESHAPTGPGRIDAGSVLAPHLCGGRTGIRKGVAR